MRAQPPQRPDFVRLPFRIPCPVFIRPLRNPSFHVFFHSPPVDLSALPSILSCLSVSLPSRLSSTLHCSHRFITWYRVIFHDTKRSETSIQKSRWCENPACEKGAVNKPPPWRDQLRPIGRERRPTLTLAMPRFGGVYFAIDGASWESMRRVGLVARGKCDVVTVQD